MMVKNDHLIFPAEISLVVPLVGSGATLLDSRALANSASPNLVGVFQDPWTGFGGVGRQPR